MSNKTDEKTNEQQAQNPAYVEELLKSGTAILKANTREGLAELVNNIPADCKYMAGAVGRNDLGEYTLQVDLIKKLEEYGNIKRSKL